MYVGCGKQGPYSNESSSAMRRNFSDVECSVAVLSAPESPQGPHEVNSENALPLGLYLTHSKPICPQLLF